MADRLARKVGVAIDVDFELIQAQIRQTGKAGTCTARVFDPTGALFSTPAVSELTLGGSPRAVYRFSFTPNAVGRWIWTLDESTGPFAKSGAFDLVATLNSDELATIIATGGPGPWTTGGGGGSAASGMRIEGV